MEENIIKKRGRPVGYELTDESKNKIRQSRLGKPHSKETKNKISRSLIRYFRKRDPVSNGLENEYKYFPKEAKKWLADHRDEIDNTDDIISNKRIVYLGQLEVCYGSDIENLCHLMTPEFLLMLKEELAALEMTDELQELFSLI